MMIVNEVGIPKSNQPPNVTGDSLPNFSYTLEEVIG
jgi:hypothetical protein